MFEQDYLMRMIMQVSHYIARIIRLRSEQRPDKAQLLLGQGYEYFFGLSIEMLEKMNAEELLDMLRHNGRDHEQVYRALLEFLQVHIEIIDSLHMDTKQGEIEHNDIVWRFKKVTFWLLLHEQYSDIDWTDVQSVIEADLDRCLHFIMPANFYVDTIRYFESTSRYARAEDVLYLWWENAEREHVSTIRTFGIQFYERLLALNHQELERGNLPMDEVEFGRKQWLTQHEPIA